MINHNYNVVMNCLPLFIPTLPQIYDDRKIRNMIFRYVVLATATIELHLQMNAIGREKTSLSQDINSCDCVFGDFPKRRSSTPLSPLDWTVMPSSLDSLARTSRNCNTFKTALPGSWWVRKYEPRTPSLHSVHWLPVSLRIDHQVLLLRNWHAPPYLQELITPQNSTPILRSTNSSLFRVPNTKLRPHGRPGLLLIGQSPWPREVNPDPGLFKTGLKTFLFRKELLTVKSLAAI